MPEFIRYIFHVACPYVPGEFAFRKELSISFHFPKFNYFHLPPHVGSHTTLNLEYKSAIKLQNYRVMSDSPYLDSLAQSVGPGIKAEPFSYRSDPWKPAT